ncbi:MAG: peptidoglycan-associated lipoprotein Pal [Betaproteobacteria bacterium]|nr:peptidoglycan-associated lipoprotein Pal [Betaproteobacteria bacterium]
MIPPLTRLLAAAALAALAACSSVKLDEAPGSGAPVENRSADSGASATSGGAPAATADAGAAPGARAVTPVEVSRKDPLDDPAGQLARRSIYFDFDQYTIKDEHKATLEAHARYLIANRGRKVVIQGNTDERGSREYNLALGQKRAEAVRKALVALGVPDGQLEAVSFGEEKPRAAGSDDAAMAENRRADLAYQ